MSNVKFITKVHTSTKRDYLQRVIETDKAERAEVACQFGKDYWDGDRLSGYGGYKYDGRWRTVADDLVSHYGLEPGARILDVGCGKGFLLYDLTQALPGVEVAGIDISQHAIENAKEEVRPFLRQGNANDLPFEDNSFDLVISITTLHNLYVYDLWKSLKEIERVGRGAKFIVVEAYRNEREKVTRQPRAGARLQPVLARETLQMSDNINTVHRHDGENVRARKGGDEEREGSEQGGLDVNDRDAWQQVEVEPGTANAAQSVVELIGWRVRHLARRFVEDGLFA